MAVMESEYLRVEPDAGRFQVNRKVFTDPRIYEIEVEKILSKTWMYIAHESEVRELNSYLTRQILDKSIIIARDGESRIHAFFNTCSHRGAPLCRDPGGIRKVFSCPYHGWVFRNSGELQSQNTEDGFKPLFNDDGRYDMARVPRLEIRSGFVFVNFDPDAMSLDDYLGDAGDRIDMIADHSKDGLEVIQGCHEYTIKANYKLMAENSLDGYHLGPTHGSYIEYQRALLKGAMREEINGCARSLTNGHACFEMDMYTGRPLGQWLPVWGEEARIAIDAAVAELTSRVGPERAGFIANTHRNMVIFPTTVINDERTILVRSIVPTSFDRMIVRSWALAPVGEAPVLRKIRVENALSFLGPGGFATPDDIEILEACQRAYMGGGVVWNDVSKGFGPEEYTPRDSRHWTDEIQMRAFWVQYEKMMLA